MNQIFTILTAAAILSAAAVMGRADENKSLRQQYCPEKSGASYTCATPSDDMTFAAAKRHIPLNFVDFQIVNSDIVPKDATADDYTLVGGVVYLVAVSKKTLQEIRTQYAFEAD